MSENPGPGLSWWRRFLDRRELRTGRLALLVLILLVPAVVLVRWLTRKGPDAAPGRAAEEGAVVLGEKARRDAGIAVEPARRLTLTDRLEAPGVLALDEARTARIGSLVEGVVVGVMAEVGDRVAAGQRLAHLNSHIIHDAWADYRKAVAERRRRETELEYANLSSERASRLLEAKAISVQERQRAEADRVAAAEELERAKTEVRRSEEALEHLGITSGEDPSGEKGEEIPVKSPIAGVVLEKKITAGTAVIPGSPLFVVSDLGTLWALAEIDETKLPLVRAGESAEIRVSAWPNEVFRGRVTFVGDAVNPRTRRVMVRCQVPNPAGRLKPEMYASIALGEGAPRPVLAVPAGAVQEMDGKTVVFVPGAAGRFTKREVKIGTETGGWVEVSSGLSEGEKVASDGSFLLKSELLKGTERSGD
ncbi:MAG TPA: efflux RND transporter periplasmic adaptor subunit [Thermoanaerobaculia bacterium]|nr:efflux RND transporter periplasmic adaptor subunit [Thermoanaerobaculia bacterium]HQR67402.1 efflux RND transporter periplasmic adaptor subunit [Thermoanaerobaculia bacterium]